MKDDYNRKIMISIKLTEQENTYLREKAQEAGCNLSEYCYYRTVGRCQENRHRIFTASFVFIMLC